MNGLSEAKNRETGLDRLELSLLDQPDAVMGKELERTTRLKHHFAPGVYAREMTIPEGLAVIGHRHRHEHLNIVTKGVAVVACDGQPTKLVRGPCVFVSQPEVRKAVVVLSEFQIINIHPTEETDLQRIEEATIQKSEGYREYMELLERANNFIEEAAQ